MLRDITITGEPDYRHGFNEFFSIFGSTIKSLTHNITIHYDQSFFTQFEHNLFDEMLFLTSYNFVIVWHRWNYASKGATFIIDIQTFLNNKWQQFRPVVCWDPGEKFNPQTTMCNLPYKFNCYMSYYLFF